MSNNAINKNKEQRDGCVVCPLCTRWHREEQQTIFYSSLPADCRWFYLGIQSCSSSNEHTHFIPCVNENIACLSMTMQHTSESRILVIGRLYIVFLMYIKQVTPAAISWLRARIWFASCLSRCHLVHKGHTTQPSLCSLFLFIVLLDIM